MSLVYTARAQRAHYLTGSPNSFTSALCGHSPTWPHYWFGTGSQDETRVAEALPLCKLCRRRAEVTP